MRQSALRGFSSAPYSLLYSAMRSLMHMVGLLLVTLNPQPGQKPNKPLKNTSSSIYRWHYTFLSTEAAARQAPTYTRHSFYRRLPASWSSFRVHCLCGHLREWLISLSPSSFSSYLYYHQTRPVPTLLPIGRGKKASQLNRSHEWDKAMCHVVQPRTAAQHWESLLFLFLLEWQTDLKIKTSIRALRSKLWIQRFRTLLMAQPWNTSFTTLSLDVVGTRVTMLARGQPTSCGSFTGSQRKASGKWVTSRVWTGLISQLLNATTLPTTLSGRGQSSWMNLREALIRNEILQELCNKTKVFSGCLKERKKKKKLRTKFIIQSVWSHF